MMDAMVIDHIRDLKIDNSPLSPVRMPIPKIKDNQILIKVNACGVCHTELDEIEGRTAPSQLPIIPGHQVVGRIVEMGPLVDRFSESDRVGVAWIFSSCGECDLCRSGHENLCLDFKATGRDAHGGYAQYMVADQNFAYPIPDSFTDVEAAPLLCAGAIGYRSLSLTGLKDGERLGLTGFGASAHLVLKMVRYKFPNSPVYVFARNPKERLFALELGAVWSGDITDEPVKKMHRIIDTTPAWKPVVHALKNICPGGRLVINAIRKEPGDQASLMDITYEEHLWQEKEIKSVANVTRKDVVDFLLLSAMIPIKPEVQTYGLHEANKALLELKHQKIRGAKVLVF